MKRGKRMKIKKLITSHQKIQSEKFVYKLKKIFNIFFQFNAKKHKLKEKDQEIL